MMPCSLTPRGYANFYVLIATVVAVALLLSYPPMRGPHEWQHFLRGLTFSTLYKDGTLPDSIFKLVNKARGSSKKIKTARKSSAKKTEQPASVHDFRGFQTFLSLRDARASQRALFRSLIFTPLHKDSLLLAGILTSMSKKAKQRDVHYSALELNPHRRRAFVSHSNVSRYPFIDYVPHMVAGTLGDALTLKPVSIYYIVRSLCIFSGIAFGYLILRILPAFHVPAMVMLLIPSGWIMRTVQYPDYVVNIAALLFMALLARALYRATPIAWRQVAGFSATGIVLSISKLVYFPLVLSVLLIRPRQFRSAAHRIACLGIVIGLCAFASVAQSVHAFAREYNIDIFATLQKLASGEDSSSPSIIPAAGGKPARGFWLQRLLAQPLQIFQEAKNTYGSKSYWQRVLHNSMLWRAPYSERLKPYGVYPLLLLLLPFFFCIGNAAGSGRSAAGSSFRFSLYDRATLMGLILVTIALITLGLYLAQFRLRSAIFGIQGRYFVPLLPFVAMACSLRVPDRWRDACLFAQLGAALAILFLLYQRIV